jgi:hypothetical protein
LAFPRTRRTPSEAIEVLPDNFCDADDEQNQQAKPQCQVLKLRDDGVNLLKG